MSDGCGVGDGGMDAVDDGVLTMASVVLERATVGVRVSDSVGATRVGASVGRIVGGTKVSVGNAMRVGTGLGVGGAHAPTSTINASKPAEKKLK